VITLWELPRLWWFFLKSRCLVPCCELFFLCTFSSFSMFDPSLFICSRSSISFHSHLVLSMISLPCALNPFCALSMHIRCSWSSLHTLLVFFMHFLCTLNAFNPHCTCSMRILMHVRCYKSSLCAFYVHFYPC
jgi:hypothetical protein